MRKVTARKATFKGKRRKVTKHPKRNSVMEESRDLSFSLYTLKELARRLKKKLCTLPLDRRTRSTRTNRASTLPIRERRVCLVTQRLSKGKEKPAGRRSTRHHLTSSGR